VIETVLIVLLFISSLAAAYFYARSQAQQRTLDYLTPELREWQNIALQKEGLRPLGYKPKDRTETVEPSHRVVLRGDLEARAKGTAPSPTIHADGIAAPNREKVVAAAEKIVNATK
jgi:hypothetical protein